jgi:hypothetical protein
MDLVQVSRDFENATMLCANFPQRPENPDAGSPFPWKPVVISVAIGQFAIETWINLRQLRVLRLWSVPSTNENQAWEIKRTRLRI